MYVNTQTSEDPDRCLLIYDGLDDAFIGVAEGFGRVPVACYSKKKTIKILKDTLNVGQRKAYQIYEYDYLRSDFGDATPIFLDDVGKRNV